MEMIHSENLIYEYDKRDEEGNIIGTNRAIDGVDIDVPQGSFVAILGHNGSRKVYPGETYECDSGSHRRNHVGRWQRHKRSG